MSEEIEYDGGAKCIYCGTHYFLIPTIMGWICVRCIPKPLVGIKPEDESS